MKDLNKGLVFRSTGSWYDVVDQNGKKVKARLRGKFKLDGIKNSNPIAVGDYVFFTIENDGFGVITQIEERQNYIIRKSIHKTAHGQIIASNLDQAVLLATLNHPKTSLGFIDRFLVAAESYDIPCIIVFNKADLIKEKEKAELEYIRNIYETIGYKTLVISAIEKTNIEEFRELLKDKKTLISGHSGVGKSTLLNTLFPNLNQKTAEISDFSNKGVHTTTFAEMFEIEPNSYVIDTPGIKELGLFELSNQDISFYFPEIRSLVGECKFQNCTHIHEPACRVLELVENGDIAKERYFSYLSMIENSDNRR